MSEEIYRVLYEDIPSMYFTVDTDGTVISVNRFGADELGFSREELIGQPVFGVFHQEDHDAVREQLRACSQNPGQAFEWRLRKRRRDGSLMWVHERARAVLDADGHTLILIVCEDITERRRTEEELRESHERYRDLYRRTPVMLHSIDKDYRMVAVSDYWLEVMGYDRDEVIGRRNTEFMTPASRELAKTALPKFMKEGVADVQYQFIKKSGEVIDIDLSAVSEHDAEGNFVRSLSVLQDMTERNRTTKALQEAHDEQERRVNERTAELERQRAFLRQIIDVDPNFIFAKDRRGRFVLVNQALADAYGTTVEQLIGKTDAHFNDNPEEVEFFRRMDLEVMNKQEERFIPEEVITDSDGRIRWLQTVKRPLIGADGTAHMVLGSATDITTRRQTNEKLRVSQAALLRSQENLRDLAGRILSAQEEERRRLAREIHDDLTQRLAGLAIQAGGMEKSLEGVIDPESMDQLRDISQDLSRLSVDVQSLSRQLHPRMLEMLGLEDALRNECQQVSERFDMNVAFESRSVPDDLSPQSGIVFYRIAQEALHNVASHAHTQNASVSLAADGTWLRLTVSDPGAGFDPAHPGRKRGIGLASMEERARLIRAELSIESRPGEGTTILLKAPLAEHGTVGPETGPPHPTDTGS